MQLSLHLPRGCVPALAVCVHLASYGTLLPWPLVRSPLHRLCRAEGDLACQLMRRLPLAQPPGAFAEAWLYYAAAPHLLPRGFPHALPLQHVLGPSRARLVWAAVGCLALACRVQQRALPVNLPYACLDLPTSTSRAVCVSRAVEAGAAAWSARAAAADLGGTALRLAFMVGVPIIGVQVGRRTLVQSSAHSG